MSPMRVLLVSTVFAASIMATNPAQAARLLRYHVELNGEDVLTIYYDDNGRPNAATIWRYLADEPIMVEEESLKIAPEPSDALETVIEGAIVIRATHASRTLASASASKLTLVRSSPDSPWHLPKDEVERTAGLAGLAAASNAPAGGVATWALVLFAFAAFAVLVSVVVVFLALSQRDSNPSPKSPNVASPSSD